MQELDARLIERLHNARVSLLLYVADSGLRSRLRLDLQRLQVPELNEDNYSSIFPRLVAEVWRCYAESLVQTSIDSERIKRLEAELRVRELESDASESIFTASEQAEFKAIWARIDRKLPLNVFVERKRPPKPLVGGMVELDSDVSLEAGPDAQTLEFLLFVGALFRQSVLKQKFQPSTYVLHDAVESDLKNRLNLNADEFQISFEIPFDIESELLKFGFAQRQYAPPPATGSRLENMMRQPFKLMFTSKFDRFAFWVEQVLGDQDATAILVNAA